MSIFDVLTMLGGLSLFLFGMNTMGGALERKAGTSLRTVLEKLTGNPAMGLLTGLFITAVIQSSSATTVMVVGFVNSGLMTLRQSIHVIMGANVGTTVTAWLLSLAGLSGENIFVQLLKPSSFTPVLALIGIVFLMFVKNDKKKDTALILLGFATLMFGMETMSGAVEGLKEVPAFTRLFLLFENPLLGVLAGAVLTAVIQSSSASVGILQALASTGAIRYGAAIPIIMGQNIGTCITALLSAIGATKNARRAAFVHLSFNVIGTVFWLVVFMIAKVAFAPTLLLENASLAGIAVCHSVFNILCTVLLLPCAKLLEKLALTFIRETKSQEKTAELDERFLGTPSVALQRSHALTLDMAKIAAHSLSLSLDALKSYTPDKLEQVQEDEAKTDHYEDTISSYLVKLSSRPLSEKESNEATRLLKIIGDFERIGDHSVNLAESAEEMATKNLSFSPEAAVEMGTICSAVREITERTLEAFLHDDKAGAATIEPLEEIVDELKEELRTRHIKRMQQGLCSIELGFVWSDLLNNLERVSDHCSNIAVSLLEMDRSEMHPHEALRIFRADSAEFKQNLLDFQKKYSLP